MAVWKGTRKIRTCGADDEFGDFSPSPIGFLTENCPFSEFFIQKKPLMKKNIPLFGDETIEEAKFSENLRGLQFSVNSVLKKQKLEASLL